MNRSCSPCYPSSDCTPFYYCLPYCIPCYDLCRPCSPCTNPRQITRTPSRKISSYPPAGGGGGGGGGGVGSQTRSRSSDRKGSATTRSRSGSRGNSRSRSGHGGRKRSRGSRESRGAGGGGGGAGSGGTGTGGDNGKGAKEGGTDAALSGPVGSHLGPGGTVGAGGSGGPLPPPGGGRPLPPPAGGGLLPPPGGGGPLPPPGGGGNVGLGGGFGGGPFGAGSYWKCTPNPSAVSQFCTPSSNMRVCGTCGNIYDPNRRMQQANTICGTCGNVKPNPSVFGNNFQRSFSPQRFGPSQMSFYSNSPRMNSNMCYCIDPSKMNTFGCTPMRS